MLSRIELRNFRGFSTLTAHLRPVSVVVGPNSAGKTTLLHAVRVALRLASMALSWGGPKVRERKGERWIAVTTNAVLRDHTKLVPLADWRALFLNQVTGEGVGLEIELEFDDDAIQTVFVGLWCGRNEQLKLEVWIRSDRALAQVDELPGQSKHISPRLTEFLADRLPRAVFIPSFYGVVQEEQLRAQAVVTRMLGAGDQSHIVRNLVARLSADAFDRLNSFLQEALGAKIVARTSMAEADDSLSLAVRFRDDNGTLELSAAGAGLVNLIALYAALERFGTESRTRQVVYLLDEPEAHLHPRLQGDMAHLVSSLVVKQFGAQVVMATHAVEIVNRLATRDDAVLLRVDRSSPTATVLRGQPEIVAELESWADMTPFSAINFLASRRVLFHEGKTDERIIRRCAELRFRNDLRGMDRFDAWTFAELEGSGNRHMGTLLGKLIDKVTPSSPSASEPLRVLTVLDRDHERAPGWTTDSAEGPVESRTLVWERHSIESLFLSPAILEAWLGAWLGDRAPGDLGRRIEAAIEAADRDEDLNLEAQGQLQARLLRDRPRDDKTIIHAFRDSKKMIEDDPGTWQRGKDRARRVLGTLRDGFPHPIARQMPTELSSLLERVDRSRFGDVERPIPPAIRDLLDQMTAR